MGLRRRTVPGVAHARAEHGQVLPDAGLVAPDLDLLPLDGAELRDDVGEEAEGGVPAADRYLLSGLDVEVPEGVEEVLGSVAGVAGRVQLVDVGGDIGGLGRLGAGDGGLQDVEDLALDLGDVLGVVVPREERLEVDLGRHLGPGRFCSGRYCCCWEVGCVDAM